jgi:hypothetical protein
MTVSGCTAATFHQTPTMLFHHTPTMLFHQIPTMLFHQTPTMLFHQTPTSGSHIRLPPVKNILVPVAFLQVVARSYSAGFTPERLAKLRAANTIVCNSWQYKVCTVALRIPAQGNSIACRQYRLGADGRYVQLYWHCWQVNHETNCRSPAALKYC